MVWNCSAAKWSSYTAYLCRVLNSKTNESHISKPFIFTDSIYSATEKVNNEIEINITGILQVTPL